MGGDLEYADEVTLGRALRPPEPAVVPASSRRRAYSSSRRRPAALPYTWPCPDPASVSSAPPAPSARSRWSSSQSAATTRARSPRPARPAPGSPSATTRSSSRRRRHEALSAGDVDLFLFSVGTGREPRARPRRVGRRRDLRRQVLRLPPRRRLPARRARGEREPRPRGARARPHRRQPELLHDPAHVRPEAAPRRGAAEAGARRHLPVRLGRRRAADGAAPQRALRRAQPRDGLDVGGRRVGRGVEAPRRDAARSSSCPTSRSAPRACACRCSSATPRRSGSSSRSRSRREDATAILSEAPSVRVLRLPEFPTPKDAAGGDEVLVGRIRKDEGTPERPRALPRVRQPAEGSGAERDPDRRGAARRCRRRVGAALAALVLRSARSPRRGAEPAAAGATAAPHGRCSRSATSPPAPRDGDEQTAALVAKLPGTIAALGDIAYPNGTARRLRALLRPELGAARAADPTAALGNHEYNDRHGGRRDRALPAAAARLVQLRARRLARRRAQLELRRGRRLRRGLAAVALAPGRSRSASEHAARSRTGTTRASAPGSTAPTRRTQPFWDLLARARRRRRRLGATTTTTSASRRSRASAQFVVGTGGAEPLPDALPAARERRPRRRHVRRAAARRSALPLRLAVPPRRRAARSPTPAPPAAAAEPD